MLKHNKTRIKRSLLKTSITLFAALVAVGLLVGVAAAVPTLTASKFDALIVDNDSDNVADPGDTIRYTVGISNSGTMDATNVDFFDTIDFYTTLVAGSVRTTPIARHENYASIGNVGITVPAGSGVLANDNDPDGTTPVLTIFGIVGCADVAAPFDCPSFNGGDVSLAADGSFTYDPALGFIGNDSFTYTVEDTDSNQDVAIAYFSVTDMIWFIDNTAAAGGDGRLNSPFDSLSDHNGNTADANGDTVFIYSGSGDYSGGITLQNSQLLIGQGATASLASLAGITPPAHSNALPATGGSRPVITNTGGNGITLASGNTIRGLNVGTSSSTGISGSSVGSLTISEVAVDAGANAAVFINTGNLNVTFDSVSSSGSADVGISLSNTTGSFSITGSGTTDGSGGTLQNLNDHGIELISVQNVSISNMNLTNAALTQEVAPNTATCTNLANGNNLGCNAPVYMVNASNISLTNLTINGSVQHGVNGNNVNGLSISNTDVTNIGDQNKENGMHFINLLGTVSFSNVSVIGSDTRNVLIENNTGTANMTVTNSTFNTAGSEVGLDFLGLSNANITFSVTDSSFTDNNAPQLKALAEDNSVIDATITGNDFDGNPAVTGNSGIDLAAVDSGTLTFDVIGTVGNSQTFQPFRSHAINVFASGAGTASGKVNGNTILGSQFGAGISAVSQVTDFNGEDPSITIEIDGNMISGVQGAGLAGIHIEARDGTSGLNGTGTIDATVTNNDVTTNNADAAIQVYLSDLNPGSTPQNRLCLNATGNLTEANGGAFGETDFFFGNDAISGANSGVAQMQGFSGSVSNTWFNVNSNTTTTLPTPLALGLGPIGGGTCGTVALLLPAENDTMFAQADDALLRPEDSAPPAVVLDTRPNAASAELVALTALVEPVAMSDQRPATGARPISNLQSPIADLQSRAPGLASPLLQPDVMVPLGDLNPGQIVVITFDVTVDGTLSMTQVCNQGLFTSGNHDDLLTDDPSVGGVTDPTCTPAEPPPTFSFEKKTNGQDADDANGAKPVLDAGDPVTWTYEVTNPGSSSVPQADVNLADDILGDLVLAGVNQGGVTGPTGDGGIPGELEPGETWVYSITGTALVVTTGDPGAVLGSCLSSGPNSTFVYENEGTLTITNVPGTFTDLSHYCITPEADLSITKSDSPDPVTVGNNVIYTITVDNNGPSDATNVVATDTLPGSVTFVETVGCAEDPSGVPACTLGTIPAGSSAQYTIEVTTNSDGLITNNVSVTSDTTDPDGGNNSASEDTTAQPPLPEVDLAITKDDGQTEAVPGTQVTYTIVVANNGPNDVTGATVADTFPAALSNVSWTCAASAGSSCTAGPVAGDISDTVDILDGGTLTYTATGDVDPSATGTLENTASVTAPASVNDTEPNNDIATDSDTLTPEADLSITKSDSPDPVTVGNNVIYTITVDNNGPSDATNVVATDTLPGSVSLVETVSCAEDPNGVPTCTLGTIPAGGFAQYTIEVTTNSVGPITNNVSVTSDTTDPDGGNNSASEDTTVQPPTGTIIVDKVTDPAGDPTIFGFELTDVPTGTIISLFSLDDDDTPFESPALNAGTYSVVETANPGYDTSLSCVDPDGGTTTAGAEATIDLDAGETITCTFTNTGKPIYVSSSSSGTAGGVGFQDEDILAFDPGSGTWSMVFDGSDVDVDEDVNGFLLLNDGSILLTFDESFSLSGVGTVDDSDIVQFFPTSLGTNTAGSFSMFFDGSDVGLSGSSEKVDAIGTTPDGRLVISTNGSFSVNGASGSDEDLMVFNATSFGSSTSGSFDLYFDGSDVEIGSEDLESVWIDPVTNEIYLAVGDPFSVTGASGDNSDIFVCLPGSLVPTTSCTYSPFWDGSQHDFGGEEVDGVSLGSGASITVPAAPPGAATLVSPSGPDHGNLPTYNWNVVSNASWYYLWVEGPGGTVYNDWHQAADVCSGGTCSYTPGAAEYTPPGPLADGPHTWWIRTWNDAGYGPWSDGMDFTVGPAVPPGAATLVSPSGPDHGNLPTYTWNVVGNSSWYYLWVDGPSGTEYNEWHQARDVCSGGTCSYTPDASEYTPPGPLADGPHTWWIRTWNRHDYGPWSVGMDFTVGPAVPPDAPSTPGVSGDTYRLYLPLVLKPAGSTESPTPPGSGPPPAADVDNGPPIDQIAPGSGPPAAVDDDSGPPLDDR